MGWKQLSITLKPKDYFNNLLTLIFVCANKISYICSMKKIQNSQHEQICDLYKQGASSNEIGRRFGITGTQVLNVLQKNGVERRKGILAGKEAEIIHMYTVEDQNIVTISKKYGVNNTSIHRLLLREGVSIKDASDSRRKYEIDTTYFERIDTEDKAYFLGLLYADGNLAKTEYSVSISLQEKDKEILEIFKEKMSYSNTLKLVSYRKKGYQDQYKLHFCNRKMYKDLVKLGCVPAKSLILKFPSDEIVPEAFLNHFIRGYFDGDGCVFITPEKRGGVIILGTEEFLVDLNNILQKECGMKDRKPTKTQSKAYEYECRSKPEVKLFEEYIYRDASIFLRRKKEKFNELSDSKRREVA
jgi:hypothetical protein